MLKIILVVMMLAPVPVLAGERSAASANVSYTDLDLTSAAGRAELDQRIRAEAKAVCHRELRGSDWAPREMHLCVRAAAAGARKSAARLIARTGPTRLPDTIVAVR